MPNVGTMGVPYGGAVPKVDTVDVSYMATRCRRLTLCRKVGNISKGRQYAEVGFGSMPGVGGMPGAIC